MSPRTIGTALPARNLGIDALRCVAMLLIVCLHVMNRGGAIPPTNTAAAIFIYPLRIFASAAVNIYALISGYVTLKGRFRPARVMELWLQVLVLNVVIGLAGALIWPGSMDHEFWIRYIFPFTQKAFWYFSAYVCVYAFSPVINRGVLALSRRQAVTLVWILLLVFSLGSYLGYANQGDPFAIASGYSALWLLVLYVVGACVRHSGFFDRVSTGRLILSLCLCVLLMTGLWRLLLLESLPEDFSKLREQMLRYSSPGITAVSLLTLALFSRMQPRGAMGSVIGFLAPLTFGVYIIHVHHVIWLQLENLFKPLLRLPAYVLSFAVIGCALGLFFACVLVDYLRAQLFRLLRVRKGMDRLEAALRRLAAKMIKETNGKENG